MPLYRIMLSSSHNPLRRTSRVIELPDLRHAQVLAIKRLDHARLRTYVGKSYDSWHIFDAAPTSLRKLPLASGRAR